MCGVGSGGTITGLSRFFARVAPQVEMVLADPLGSVLADYVEGHPIGEAGSWLVEGIGEDFVPPIADLSRVRTAYKDQRRGEPVDRSRPVEAGGHSGRLVLGHAGSRRSALLPRQSAPKRVVTLVCDSGGKYLSKMFDDFWMADRGFLTTAVYGDLRDVVSHRFADGAVVSVGPDDPLNVVYARMRLHDVSQLPVLARAGLWASSTSPICCWPSWPTPAPSGRPVREYMATKLQTVPPQTPLKELLPVFDAGHVAIVADEGGFYGLITRVDVVELSEATTPRVGLTRGK